MAMKGYTEFPKASALQKPHNQIAWCRIQDMRGWEGGKQKCGRYILQPQPTGQTQQYTKLYLYDSYRRMDLTLNNPRRLMFHDKRKDNIDKNVGEVSTHASSEFNTWIVDISPSTDTC